MLNFQQQAEQDLDLVFLNATAKEFVTTHKIAKNKVATAIEFQIVVDHELYTERKIRDKAEGITLNGLVFFVKKSDWIENFDNMPRIGDTLCFDNEMYQVSVVNEVMEMLEITLESNRGKGYQR